MNGSSQNPYTLRLHKAPGGFANREGVCKALGCFSKPLGASYTHMHSLLPRDMGGDSQSAYTEGALHIQRGLCEAPRCYQVKCVHNLHVCVDVRSYICLHSNMKLLSMNDICLHPYPVLILYMYKYYSFTKPGSSILIPSYIHSTLVTLFNLICWCVQPGVVSLLS